MQISLDQLIETVTKEVVRQLKEQGVTITASPGIVQQLTQDSMQSLQTKTERIDMSRFKSPILTERHIQKLHVLTGKVIVPKRTIITPKAKELLKQKNLTVEFE